MSNQIVVAAGVLSSTYLFVTSLKNSYEYENARLTLPGIINHMVLGASCVMMCSFYELTLQILREKSG